MKALRILFALLLAGANAPVHAQQTVVFEEALTGVSAITNSAILRNVGQAMHTLQVTFPAENATVSNLDVVLQWCTRNCDVDASWRFAGVSITEAPVLDQGIPGRTDVIAYQTYYGVFRALRVRNNAATPGGELMTVQYTGDIFAVVPFFLQSEDRWSF